jgi:hypothetical protein
LDLFVVNLPVITVQPQGLTVDAGLEVRLSARATGTEPLSYAWTFNGVELGGATSPTLVLPGIGAEQGGDYRLIVRNDYGSVTSAVATVTVLTAPTLEAAPTDLIANLGDSVTFSVSVSGLAPFTFQWRKNGVNIEGATHSSLTLTDVQVGDGATYTVVISNPGGEIVGGPAQLIIGAPPVAGSDLFAFATPLTGDQGLISGTNTLATR